MKNYLAAVKPFSCSRRRRYCRLPKINPIACAKQAQRPCGSSAAIVTTIEVGKTLYPFVG